MNKEEMIAKHMNVLGITREEAIQLIADDEEIDRMTRTIAVAVNYCKDWFTRFKDFMK